MQFIILAGEPRQKNAKKRPPSPRVYDVSDEEDTVVSPMKRLCDAAVMVLNSKGGAAVATALTIKTIDWVAKTN